MLSGVSSERLFNRHLHRTQILSKLSVRNLDRHVSNTIDGRTVSGCRRKIVFPASRVFVGLYRILKHDRRFFTHPIACSVSRMAVSFQGGTNVNGQTVRILRRHVTSRIRQ